MKKLLYIIIGIAVLGTAACSNIDESERLVYVDPTFVPDTIPEPIDEGNDTFVVVGASRRVLIEDFTGQECPNCPRATDIIEQILSSALGSSVVPVGIHSGPMSTLPSKHPEGLATELGNTYYDYWKIEAQPMGIIDRLNIPLNTSAWVAKVQYDLTLEAPSLNVGVRNTLDDTESKVNIEVQVIGVSESANDKLQVWLVEDGIVAFQDLPDGSRNPSYTHNHVLRDAVNGTWGEAVQVAEGELASFEYSYTLNPEWKVENMAVVAFVYNDAGVVQVTKKSLK